MTLLRNLKERKDTTKWAYDKDFRLPICVNNGYQPLFRLPKQNPANALCKFL